MKRCSHRNLANGTLLGLNFLREKDCEKIHEASLEILKDRGMAIDDEKARTVLCDNGCWQDADGYIRFPRSLVERSLETAPTQFTHYGRTPDDDIRIAPDQVYAANFGEGIFIYDLITSERRSTKKQDAINVVRIIDSLNNIHIYNRALAPQDVPTESANMHNAEVGLCYSSKPMSLVANSAYQVKKLIEMADIAVGGKAAHALRPRHAFNTGTISPLFMPKDVCECIMLVAEAGMTNTFINMAQQGTSAPASIAGTVVLHNTEFMALNTLVQCVNKGVPVFYGSATCSVDMRRGTSITGAPEAMLLGASMARMAKHYKIPSYISGGWTDSCTNDVQAGAERTINRLLTALAGASVLFGQGLLEAGLTYDVSSLIIDDEILDYVLRILAGFKVNPETLSVDLIKEVGPFGTYLAEEDTANRIHELSTYSMMNRKNYDTWAAEGKRTISEVANARAIEILATYKQHNPLSEDRVKAIRQVVIDAEAELGVTEFWKGKEDTRFIDDMLY